MKSPKTLTTEDSLDIFVFLRSSIILLMHVVEDGSRLRAAVLKSGDLQTLSEISCLPELKASQKTDVILNEKVFQKIVPESAETLETTKDKIEVKIKY